MSPHATQTRSVDASRRSAVRAACCALAALSACAFGAAPGNEAQPGRLHAGSGRAALTAGREPGPAQAPGATCAEATAISGDGVFSLVRPTGKGRRSADALNALFDPAGKARDRWWRWTATATGPVTMTIDGIPVGQGHVAVYEPGADCALELRSVLASSLLGMPSERSEGCAEAVIHAIAGQQYLVRIGSKRGGGDEEGDLRIATARPLLCSLNACQELSDDIAYLSDGVGYRVADNWKAPATGTISSLCFWGAYGIANPANPPSDQFRVTYYRRQGNFPGAAIATFTGSQLGVVARRDSGAKIDGEFNIFEYSVCHPPIQVEKDQVIWVEVVNTVGASVWGWSSAEDGDGVGYQDITLGDGSFQGAFFVGDFAFCLGLSVDCPLDTNGDGRIDFADLNMVIPVINSVCP